MDQMCSMIQFWLESRVRCFRILKGRILWLLRRLLCLQDACIELQDVHRGGGCGGGGSHGTMVPEGVVAQSSESVTTMTA